MIVDKLCARCGKLMVQVEHNRKRCPECALIVHREQARQRQRDRKEEMLQRGVQRVKKATILEKSLSEMFLLPEKPQIKGLL